MLRILRPACGVVLAALLLLSLSPSPSLQAQSSPSNVATGVWEETEDGARTEFLVVLRERAELSGAAALTARAARGRFVVQRLRATAQRSQAELRAWLEHRGAPHQPFYLVNAVLVSGDRSLVIALAARPEVARIEANPAVRFALPPTLPRSTAAPAGVEWNVQRVNADDVWGLGYTGQGVVIAGQDTGYDWDHPALIGAYRGWDGTTAEHDYNWHDAFGTYSAPYDDHGHGTHTMGTMVGDDGGSNQIGVAPGAQWIGCRNMAGGVGSPASYIECFEFFLAPYPVGGAPEDGDPTRAPHVINNSWGCPPSEGCPSALLEEAVEAVRAAGILVVTSAGNHGSGCSTMEDPPAVYAAAFSVGATTSSDGIASFSSRGPVTEDGVSRRAPDVSAPGAGVRSSRRGGGYTSMSGTSMAAPHVAGTAALLWSAVPELVGDVVGTEHVLEQTARAQTTSQGCGGDGPDDVPNNVYGWGIVDAEAAVRLPTSLKLSKQAQPALMVEPGAQITYTLQVTNTGLISLTATITDTLPLSVTPSGILTWAVTLPPGSTWMETVPVTVSAGYLGPLTNTLQATTQEGPTGKGSARVLVLRRFGYLPVVVRDG